MAPGRPVNRKRRAQSDIRGPDAHSPPQRRRTSTQTQRTPASASRRRVQASTPDDDDDEEDDDDDDAGPSGQELQQDQQVKQLVRMAMAHELSRHPIRRTEMAKVIAKGKKLNAIFDKAQQELRNVWGMEMVELPVREKRGLHQRRTSAAQNADKQSPSSKSYILVSTQSQEYRIPELVGPITDAEARYHAIVSFVLSVIYLNGRVVTHPTLKRYLDKVELTERHSDIEAILKRMQSQGYIAKAKDPMSGAEGDAALEYHIGPRAKVEFGEEGLVRLVETVYGEDAMEDLEERVKRNLGVDITNYGDDEDGEVGAAARKTVGGTQGTGTQRKGKAKGKQRATQRNGDDDDDAYR